MIKPPTKKEMTASCERAGGSYYFQISIWNREGNILMSVRSPMTKEYGKRLAKIQMEGFRTSGGLKRPQPRPPKKGRKRNGNV